MYKLPANAHSLVKDASESAGTEFPFWLSDDAKQEEGMYQLALELEHENIEEYLSEFPPGYSIVYWIFSWEQSRAGEGFCTGTDNVGIDVARKAAESYEQIGIEYLMLYNISAPGLKNTFMYQPDNAQYTFRYLYEKLFNQDF